MFFIYILQDKGTSTLCIKLTNIYGIYKTDRRTLVKWHVQIIIAKDMGIIVVCSHENIHVHRKSHNKFMTLGLYIRMVILL